MPFSTVWTMMSYAAQAQPANVCMYVSDLDKYSRCSMSLDEDPVDIASNPSLGTTHGDIKLSYGLVAVKEIEHREHMSWLLAVKSWFIWPRPGVWKRTTSAKSQASHLWHQKCWHR